MRIAAVESFIVHLPVTGNAIAGSTHQVTHWGVDGSLRQEFVVKVYGVERLRAEG